MSVSAFPLASPLLVRFHQSVTEALGQMNEAEELAQGLPVDGEWANRRAGHFSRLRARLTQIQREKQPDLVEIGLAQAVVACQELRAYMGQRRYRAEDQRLLNHLVITRLRCAGEDLELASTYYQLSRRS